MNVNNFDIYRFTRERIRQLRVRNGVTAKDMSLAIHQNHTYISKLESGHFTASIETLYTICNYFDITLSDFFDIENRNPEIVNRITTNIKNLDERSLAGLEIITEDLKDYNHIKK